MRTTFVRQRFGLEAAKQGHLGAKEAMAERLWQRLRSMARYYAARTGEDADDLLSEAWLGLLEALEVVDLSIGDPEQYLLKRARWRLLDHVKRARIRRTEPLDVLPGEPSTRREHDQQLTDMATDAFLDRLKPTQRAIMECLLDGLTWRQAGAVLGCTSANVAYHMRQIREEYAVWSALA